MTTRCLCEECGWVGQASEVLRAPNPFLKGDELSGCPKCFEPNRVVFACREDGCINPATMGTPLSDGGYAQTCWEHRPEEAR